MEFIIHSEKYGDHEVLIDREDYEKIKNHTWSLVKEKYGPYRIMAWGGKRGHSIYLSRLIMGNPKDKIVDHINGNTLDNRKQNLRICFEKENLLNRKKYITNHSGYKGVSWNKRSKKWVSQIQIEMKKIHLGYFINKIEAAIAYNEAAIKYHGEFARLNQINKVII